ATPTPNWRAKAGMPGATIPYPSATVNDTADRIAASRGRSANGPRPALETAAAEADLTQATRCRAGPGAARRSAPRQRPPSMSYRHVTRRSNPHRLGCPPAAAIRRPGGAGRLWLLVTVLAFRGGGYGSLTLCQRLLPSAPGSSPVSLCTVPGR